MNKNDNGDEMPYPPHVKETLPDVRRLCGLIAEHNIPQPKRNPMPDGKKQQPLFFEFVLDDERFPRGFKPLEGWPPWPSFDPEPRGEPEPLYNADGSWTGNRDHWPDPQPAKRYHAQVLKIEMMLHFATIVGPFVPEAQRTSPAYTKFVKQLLADDLIERPTEEEREEYQGWAYKATERGLAYVEGLKDVQLPIPVETSTTWIIPQ